MRLQAEAECLAQILSLICAGRIRPSAIKGSDAGEALQRYLSDVLSFLTERQGQGLSYDGIFGTLCSSLASYALGEHEATLAEVRAAIESLRPTIKKLFDSLAADRPIRSSSTTRSVLTGVQTLQRQSSLCFCLDRLEASQRYNSDEA